MNRDFDKFYADAYAWILFLAQTEPIESIRQLVNATPNASITDVAGVRHFKFNGLSIDADRHGFETLDEFQDYILQLIRNNPGWVAPHKEALYSEDYVAAWIRAIESLMKLYAENPSEYQLISKFLSVVKNSGYIDNLNPNK